MFCCRSKAAIDVIDDPPMLILPPSVPRPPIAALINNLRKSTATVSDAAPAAKEPSATDPNSYLQTYKHIITPRVIINPTLPTITAASEFLAEPHHPATTGHPNLIIVDASSGDPSNTSGGDVKAAAATARRLGSSSTVAAQIKDISAGAGGIVRWDARLFYNVSRHEYGTYFPVVVNQASGELFAYNENQSRWQEDVSGGAKPEWLAMPGIGFLPGEVDDVIAGDGGLLCVNGGVQPRGRNVHTPPIPHADDYNLNLYPQQSILVVCNPLTQETKFVPRHTNKKLDGKIACMQIVAGANPSAPNAETGPRTRYRVHVLGTHHEPPTLHGAATDELVLMTYDSWADTWVSGTVVGRARVPALAHTGVARLAGGFYLGGQEETDEVVVVREDVKKKRACCGQEGLGCRLRARHVWANKIFFVHASTLKWHSVDFCVAGEDGSASPQPLQPPRVVQCQAGGRVYAVTRAKAAPKTIVIYEVVIVDGFPTGVYNLVTKMPGEIYANLFESEASLKEYDCAAGHDYICFLVGPPNQSTIGICDLRKREWFMSIFSPDHKGTGRYALSKCKWTPDWKARP